MKLRSYAKINLFLNVKGKREDGYHFIETVIQRIDLFDEIYINVDKNFEGIDIRISCDKENVPLNEDNLCYKACYWFMDYYKLKGRVDIHIKKNIPLSAGLAGGTSNGAEVIKALNSIYELNILHSKLSEGSVVLGADFPYCIIGGTVLCEGIGEKLTYLKTFRNNIILLVKPDFGLTAREVYTKFNTQDVKYNVDKYEFLSCLEKYDFNQLCKKFSNVLEYSNIDKMKEIVDIKKYLKQYGAINSLMSGSGSTVYGIFDNLYIAQKAYDNFKEKYSEVFLTTTIDE